MINLNLPKAFEEIFEPYRYKAFYGGRGSAKSHTVAAYLLIMGADQPLRILCAREVQKSIKDSVHQLLKDKIDQLGLQNAYDVLNHEIRGRNGTLFVFGGLGDMSVDQIKSMEGIDKVWVEEAQTISSRSLEVLIPTIRKPGSELIFTWNPRHASDPIDERFRGPILPERALIKRVNYTENPFFPSELNDELEFDRKNNPVRFAHIWLGEYEPQAVGAIWNMTNIHEHRRHEVPDLTRILVSVDPAISNEPKSDEHGVIIAGLGEDGRAYVLEDASLKGSPQQWAERAVAMFDKWEADAIVLERNQGGDMVRHTLQTVRPGIRTIEVHATRGKHVRAEPISAMYHIGKVSHVGTFTELENQMCRMTASGYDGEGSPDRVDALVWTMTELFPKVVKKTARKRTRPQINVGWMG